MKSIHTQILKPPRNSVRFTSTLFTKLMINHKRSEIQSPYQSILLYLSTQISQSHRVSTSADRKSWLALVSRFTALDRTGVPMQDA